MKQILSILLILTLIISCSRKAGPKIRYYKKDGVQWYTSKIYGYPDGKKKLAQVDKYKKKNNDPRSRMYELQESVLYYQLWPNYEWKFVSKKGFTVRKGDYYYAKDSSIVVPDNIIHISIDSNHKEKIEVYKDGKRIPYPYGRPDGYESMQFLVDKPGVYKWKDGKEYFLREFTAEELESHRKMIEHLNKNR